MSETQQMQNDIGEIKTDLKEAVKKLNGLEVLIAGQYVPKQDFKEAEVENSKDHDKLHLRINNLVTGVSAATILFLVYALWDYIK